MDSYQWHESVLSTRPLSRISQAGSLASSALHMHSGSSRDPSLSNSRTPTRHSLTMSEYSEDGDLEMADTRQDRTVPLNGIPELPDSVAQSLLFELPREIRDRIYALCLVAKDGKPVEWPHQRDTPGVYDLQPQLLRSCRIIHDEAAPLLYTLNNLTFHHPSDANMFVHAFASSPMYGRQVASISLHIKAQDMRMWMPYLTSTDEVRSLKADYPNLKDLGVRFRSNKWQHTHPAEANLKNWSDDSRLDEIIDGLRHVFLPDSPTERGEPGEREFQEYLARNRAALRNEDDAREFRKRLVEVHKARTKIAIASRADAPVVRVCCACRVHSAHFNAITQGTNGETDTSSVYPPVQEGEPFRGFTAIDLQNGIKRLIDPDLGSANVARTPYADKNGVMLALEIHCLDPKKEPTDRSA